MSPSSETREDSMIEVTLSIPLAAFNDIQRSETPEPAHTAAVIKAVKLIICAEVHIKTTDKDYAFYVPRDMTATELLVQMKRQYGIKWEGQTLAYDGERMPEDMELEEIVGAVNTFYLVPEAFWGPC